MCRWMCMFVFLFYSTNQKLFEANIKWFRFSIGSIFLRFIRCLDHALACYCRSAVCSPYYSSSFFFRYAFCFGISFFHSRSTHFSHHSHNHMLLCICSHWFTFYKCLNNYAIFPMFLFCKHSTHIQTHLYTQYSC